MAGTGRQLGSYLPRPGLAVDSARNDWRAAVLQETAGWGLTHFGAVTQTRRIIHRDVFLSRCSDKTAAERLFCKLF